MTYRTRKKMEGKVKAVFSSLIKIIFSFVKAGVIIAMSYFIISETKRGEVFGATFMFLELSYLIYDTSFSKVFEIKDEENEEDAEEW